MPFTPPQLQTLLSISDLAAELKRVRDLRQESALVTKLLVTFNNGRELVLDRGISTEFILAEQERLLTERLEQILDRVNRLGEQGRERS